MIGIGNVVEEFTVGNTRVKICDDYCRDKSHAEVEAVLDRIARILLPHLIAVADKDT